MGKNGETILSIIDQRIDSYIKESKITCRFIGQVIEVLGNNRYKIKLMGYDTIYTFPSRPYVDAIENDYVFIESKIGNIDNGIVIDKVNGSYGYIYNKNGSSDMYLNAQGGMLKATYDRNNNGIVDNAERVNNHSVNSDVPFNAIFTDTTVATQLTMANGNTVEATIDSINKTSNNIIKDMDSLAKEDDGYYHT